MELSAWKIPELFSGDASVLARAGFEKLLATVLISRGIAAPEDAEAYLSASPELISDPFELLDMDRAVNRIKLAMEKNESLAVYGDYDVDGISASCLLCDYLKSRGLNCRVYIPDRIDEGYGLNAEALENLRREGVTLAITVDCGITAEREAAFAKGIGLDIIITDHHECPGVLPDCQAVISPKRQAPGHPAENLAGVGVALKLACALEGDPARISERYCDLVAVGTIADLVPLVGENRVMTSMGLQKLRQNPSPGFAALLEEAGAAGKPLTASVVGYTLAPRINAAGRLCETAKAVDLLMCDEEARAKALARELCDLNHRRQELELAVWRDAKARLEAAPPDGPIVLASENWHPGVVGIAASRLAEAYRLPTVMICLDGENGKGSCRSYGEYKLFDALAACGDYLEGFGGHAFAAGLNIKAGNIDAFRAAFKAYYEKSVPVSQAELAPEIQLGDFSCLTLRGVESLDRLEPCGNANPKPLFCVCNVVLESVVSIGGGKHLRLGVSKRARNLDGVFFSKTQAELGFNPGDIVDLCFIPQINDYRSQKSVQLLLQGVRESALLGFCREILRGGPDPSALAGLSLDRGELSDVWRILRSLKRPLKLGELFSDPRFERAPPEKVCAAIRVFAELGLVKAEFNGETIRLTECENAGRASLEASPLFCLLSKNGGGE